jgi:hypothetical protein
MSVLPDKVSKAWDERTGPIVFATVDENGVPNAIYATCVRKVNEDTIVVADNYFDKTRKNIFAGTRGSILFIAPEDESYQLKGTVEYHTEGDIFEDMKRWNPKEHPGHAAAVLKIEEVYAGAKRLA